MENIFQNIISFAKKPVVIITSVAIIGITYNKLNANPESAAANEKVLYKSSVSLVNGKYNVDTMVIRADINKAKLIAVAEKQILEEKNTIREVPGFIWRFLDSISCDKKIDIVNPGEDYKEGIMDYGHVIFKRVFDPNKKDSVSVISGDGAILPNKQLVYFGMSNNIVLMSYIHGGLGPNPNIIIMKHENRKITDFWYGSAWNDGSIVSRDEIMKTLKSKRKNGC
jgi:hypothetical protein